MIVNLINELTYTKFFDNKKGNGFYAHQLPSFFNL